MESTELNEKICGLIAIKVYSEILNENEILSFVNKFLEMVYKVIILENSSDFVQLGVKVYGILVGLGGINIT